MYRRHMLAQHLKAEVKLLAMDEALKESLPLLGIAQAHWCANFGDLTALMILLITKLFLTTFSSWVA